MKTPCAMIFKSLEFFKETETDAKTKIKFLLKKKRERNKTKTTGPDTFIGKLHEVFKVQIVPILYSLSENW